LHRASIGRNRAGEALFVGNDIELWSGERSVIRLEARMKQGASGVLF
jgi:hypothetical protein